MKSNFKGMFIPSLLMSGMILMYSVGCSQQPKGETVFGQDQEADYAKVVATVNGEKITEGEIADRLAELQPEVRAKFQTPSGRKEIISQMVNELILEQAAVKNGYEKDPKVAARLANAKRRVLLGALSQKEIRQLNPTEDDCKKWYGEHLADLVQPESVHVRHILVKTETDAKKILAELKKKGANFAKIASDKSLDPSTAPLGGDLQYITRGQTVPEFETAAFNTPVGELSGIVKTVFGYHIIKVEDKMAAGPIPFDKIKDQIKERVKYDLYIKPLKDAAKIDIVEKFPDSGPGAVPPAK